MNLKVNFLTKRNLLLLALVCVLLAGGLFYYFKRRQWSHTDLAEYAPSSAVAFIQIDSLPALFSGIVDTEAWRKLAPAFGLSSQFNYFGGAAQFLASTGLGPEEAVLLARAQYAIVINGLDAQTRDGDQEEARQLELVPRLAFLIETHASAAQVEQRLTNRVHLLAHRIYGPEVEASEQDYQGVKLKIFRARGSDRQLVAAQRGSLLIIGNQIESVQSCLDVLLPGHARLSQDPYLKQARERLGKNAAAFAFINGVAASRLLQLGSLLLSGSARSQRAETENSELTEALSSQIINGMAYSSTFEGGQVTDRYLALLRPEIVDALRVAIKPATDKPQLAAFVSGTDADFTLLRIERPAEALEQVLAGVSAHVNVVVSFALRQLVIELGRQYGVEPGEPIGTLLGNEMALIKFPEAEDSKSALLVEVSDKAKLLPAIGRYLKRDRGQVRSEEYRGVEIVIGHEERAAAFLGNYLALSTRAQIAQIIDAWQSAGANSDKQSRVNAVQEMAKSRGQAVIVSCRSDRQPAAELMLGLSRLLRATDGSRELLKTARVQSAVAELPPSLSATQIAADGILMETRSPLGAFTLVSGFLADPAGELRETQAAE